MIVAFLTGKRNTVITPDPTPLNMEGGMVYWNHCPSVVLFVCPIVSARYFLNRSSDFFSPNLVWWCIIIRRCVMRKNWVAIFNVKVTARAYKIKILLFLLYLQHCRSICNQTWSGSTVSKAKVSYVKVDLLR